MAPLTDISRAFGQQQSPEPISRTMQYRKVTKPLLERQRRARINRCLDELKDILINGLQAEGENVARLEKADILELTVRHLHKLQSQQNAAELEAQAKASRPIGDDERFRAGYEKCAQEVSRALAAQSPAIDIQVGTSMMIHLGTALNQMSSCGNRSPSSPSSPSAMTIQHSSVSPSGSIDSGYRPYTPPSSPQESIIYNYSTFQHGDRDMDKAPWRPW